MSAAIIPTHTIIMYNTCKHLQQSFVGSLNYYKLRTCHISISILMYLPNNRRSAAVAVLLVRVNLEQNSGHYIDTYF